MATKERKIKWFGMKLSPEQKEKIRKLADRRGVSQKKAVMDLVEKEVEDESIKAQPGSFLEEAGDLVGKGNSDLGDISTNVDKYLREWGYGQ